VNAKQRRTAVRAARRRIARAKKLVGEFLYASITAAARQSLLYGHRQDDFDPEWFELVKAERLARHREEFRGQRYDMPVAYSHGGFSQAVAPREVVILPPRYDMISITREALEASRSGKTPFNVNREADPVRLAGVRGLP
jgi:hypothetical protein